MKKTEGVVREAAADTEPETPGGSWGGSPEWKAGSLLFCLQAKLACPLDIICLQSWAEMMPNSSPSRSY